MLQKYATADPRAHKRHPGGRCLGDVIRIPAYRPPTVKSMNYHVAAFPDELVYLLVTVFSDPGDVVLDPFLGSGTTLIAAETTGRVCFGIELNPAYVDVAIERWQRFTGQPALFVTGEPFDSRKAPLADHLGQHI